MADELKFDSTAPVAELPTQSRRFTIASIMGGRSIAMLDWSVVGTLALLTVLGGRAGYFFPHDEFYDDGLREAIEFVCETAPPNAVIAHETPAVTRYYLGRFNRTDLKSHAISAPDFDPAKLSGPAHIIIQRGRIYFENRDKLEYVRRNFRKVHEIRINGLIAAEVYVNWVP